MRNPFGNVRSGGPRFPFGTVAPAPAPAPKKAKQLQDQDVDPQLKMLVQLQGEQQLQPDLQKPARKRGAGGKFAPAGEQ